MESDVLADIDNDEDLDIPKGVDENLDTPKAVEEELEDKNIK